MLYMYCERVSFDVRLDSHIRGTMYMACDMALYRYIAI